MQDGERIGQFVVIHTPGHTPGHMGLLRDGFRFTGDLVNAKAGAFGESPHLFQLYWSRSNDLVASLVHRAEACGCSAIVVTLDTTMLGWRPEVDFATGLVTYVQRYALQDGPGIRTVLALYEEAKTKRLCIAAGTQRRHQTSYQEAIRRVHNGAIGDIVAGRCYWNQGALWNKGR